MTSPIGSIVINFCEDPPTPKSILLKKDESFDFENGISITNEFDDLEIRLIEDPFVDGDDEGDQNLNKWLMTIKAPNDNLLFQSQFDTEKENTYKLRIISDATTDSGWALIVKKE